MTPFLENTPKKEYGVRSAVPYKNAMSVKGMKEAAPGKELEKRHLSPDSLAKRRHGMLDRAAEKALFSIKSN